MELCPLKRGWGWAWEEAAKPLASSSQPHCSGELDITLLNILFKNEMLKLHKMLVIFLTLAQILKSLVFK